LNVCCQKIISVNNRYGKAYRIFRIYKGASKEKAGGRKSA
jgi:hypothetical protein